ncbi:hypothetical protein [Hydrocoleum sp. CS-953]|uniref:hypothetical protein n=1 Tax=Microcoleaceae TaxID=1892252 RepID=UPI000B9B5FE7|nr:hypothetical protein [Hydrocoleum sp. CS-953]OZH54128.1 hypothetical protein AFK68_12885 [Hydrocoleum sp. CS-953]
MKTFNKLLLTTVGTALVTLSVGTAEVAQAKFKSIEANSEAHTFSEFNNRMSEGLGFSPKQSKTYHISAADRSNFVFNNNISTSTITLASEPSSINNRLNFRIDTNTIVNGFLIFNCLILMALCVLEVLFIVDEDFSN